MFIKKGIRLHIIISLLILFVVICTVSINLLISMNTHKSSLTEKYLHSNYNYAMKLTSGTEFQLDSMGKNMIAIGKIAGNELLQQDDIDAWYDANNDQFNTVFTTDDQGIVQLISPTSIQYNRGRIIKTGTKLTSEIMNQAHIDKEPLISDPYLGTSGQLITLISAPIINEETGEYKGLIGGTIHLESENVLKSILGTHEYEDHSYVYVVDKTGKLIYHPDAKRLGEDVSSNVVVQQVLNKRSGSNITTNSKGIEFFAGYSYVESTGWGIVAQTPTSIVDESLNGLFRQMVLLSIPFLVLILIIGAVLVSTIVKPINKLADFSQNIISEKEAYKEIEVLNIKSPVYEVRQIYYQVIDHLKVLNKQARMDGLTGIANRRTFDMTIKIWMEEKIPFSLILLDIDHFKKVNDMHGHLVGDEVLKYLTEEMKRHCAVEDLLFRYGGEEFGILVKHKGGKKTFELAEKLRVSIANKISPSGKPIKISLGVTSYKSSDQLAEDIINRADMALYESKETGRNKTTLFKSDNIIQLSKTQD